jgi:hypothetical protein
VGLMGLCGRLGPRGIERIYSVDPDSGSGSTMRFPGGYLGQRFDKRSWHRTFDERVSHCGYSISSDRLRCSIENRAESPESAECK